MTARSWSLPGLLVLLGCVLIAGLIGVVTPTELPSARLVEPDADGVARTERLDAQLLDATLASVIVSDQGAQYQTHEVFVVISYWAQPHGQTGVMVPSLVTRDGSRYSPYSRVDIIPHTSAVVGQAARAMIVFEVPPDKLRGARFEVVAHQLDGISGVIDTPSFRLPDDMAVADEPVTLTRSVTEAGR